MILMGEATPHAHKHSTGRDQASTMGPRNRWLVPTLRVLGFLGVLGALGVDPACAGGLDRARSSGVSASEVAALHGLYVSTQGSQWIWTGVPWNFSQPNPDPCAEQWQGIECTPICDPVCLDHVVALTLVEVGLEGSLPDALDGLVMLVNLTIHGNLHLGKSIPNSVGNLTHLQTLELSLNALTGPIPRSVGKLLELRLLDLSSNELTGVVPSTIGALSQLRDLVLSTNLLHGSLPTSMRGLVELRKLIVTNNLLSGSLPAALSEVPLLAHIELSFNHLNGSIPPEIGLFRHLEYLALDSNDLRGTIPSEMGDMPRIIKLNIGNNELTGTLPASLGRLQSLEQFSVMINKLNGSIPEELGSAYRLQNLALGNNRLSGLLPGSLGNLVDLKVLYLAHNRLRGTIPPEIGNLKDLLVLDLDDNDLGGMLPVELRQLPVLIYLHGSGNDFEGSVPSFLVHMSLLAEIVLPGNRLFGSIPDDWISTLPSLSWFDVSGNHITGSLPDDLHLAANLTRFFANHNHLDGSIMDYWSQLKALQVLEFNHNLLCGTVPRSLEALRSLQMIDGSSNLLTGPVPPSLSMVTNLGMIRVEENLLTGVVDFIPAHIEFVNISANFFTGTLASLRAYPQALAVDVSHNSLSGSLPALGPAGLRMLFLQENQFGGSMTSYFAFGPADNLVNFDVSNNRLTGRLPDAISSVRALTSFMAMENCFTGTLPPSLCEMAALQILGLDGLSTAKQCRTEAWRGVLSSYYLGASAVHGTLPECLLTMPRLQTLHLSGNALSGTVTAHEGAVGAFLTDLSVSHNRLSGSIPAALQGGVGWNNLDLSFNKFSGRLLRSAAAFSRSTEVKLEQNRLSGDIPQSYFEVQRVSILRGNMFRCEREGAALILPEGDSYKQEYSCGSDSLNAAFATWCALALFLTSLALVLMGWSWTLGWVAGGQNRDSSSSTVRYALLPPIPKSNCSHDDVTFSSHVWSWWGASSDEQALRGLGRLGSGGSEAGQDELGAETWLRPLLHATDFMQHLRGFVYRIAVFLVIVVSPAYIGLSLSFGSYTDQFAWTSSAAYLTGTTSAVALVLLFVSTALLLVTLRTGEVKSVRQLRGLADTQRDTVDDRQRETEPVLSDEKVQTDCGLVISMNYADPAPPRAAAPLAAGCYGRAAVLALVNLVVVLSANAAFVATYSSLDRVQAVVVALALSLFKIAWGVVLRQGVVRHLQPREAQGALLMENVRFLSLLVLFNNIVAPCLATLLASSSCFYYIFAQPPLISSRYIVEMCVEFNLGCVSMAAVPQETSFEPPFTYSFQCSSALLADFAYVFAYKYAVLGLVYPALVLLVTWRLHHCGRRGASVGWPERMMMLALPPLWKVDLLRHLHEAEAEPGMLDPRLAQCACADSAWLSAVERNALELAAFSSSDYAVRMALMLGTLLTFGAVLPPLGVLVSVTICSNTALTQMGLARMVERIGPESRTATARSSAWCGYSLEEIGRQCAQLAAAMQLATRPLAVLVLFFFAAFVFDTNGDASGATRGALLALPVVIVPTAVALGLRVWDFGKRGKPSSE